MTPRLDLLIPVGPDEREPERAREAIESVLAYEPDVGVVVVVDDGREPRELAVAGAEVVTLRNPRGGRGEGVYGVTCAATTTGLAWLREHGRAPLVLRLDADALVIAPFADKVEAGLRTLPNAGIVGSYHFAPTAMPRDFGVWERPLRKLRRPLWVYRRPPAGFAHVQRARAPVREQLRRALANGYRPGEHCLAAACVLTRELVERLAAAGYLDDPLAWLPTWIPDDVMLGVQTRAVGLALAGMTGEGEPFGVAQLRLPGPPEWLVAQGYSLIHPVKDRFGDEGEREVRELFRRRRAGQ
jgi:hypothetical protein